ncbi:MAG: C40 family peptidase [Candidatus Kapaibacterium sp.]
MLNKLSLFTKTPFVALLIFTFAITAGESFARKRNNPKATRAQAIEIIRTSSEEISELAGLEPNLDSLAAADTLDAVEGELLEEFEEEESVAVDIETFKMLWLSFAEDAVDEEYTAAGISKARIMEIIMDWLGTPYRYGGITERGIDCSAFIREIFLETTDVMLPRTARVQYQVGMEVEREDLEFGDLVFFHTRRYPYISHVGIYLGDGLFAHASSRHGVTVSTMVGNYYDRRFVGARRITGREIAKYSIAKSEHGGQ